MYEYLMSSRITDIRMRTYLLLTLACISFLFVGCKKEGISSEYANIFNGKDKRAMAPVDLCQGDEFYYLSRVFLDEFYSDHADDPRWPTTNGNFAVVVNDASLLKDYKAPDGRIFRWPEIDLKKYSLVVGQFVYGGTFLRYKEQRAVVSEGKTTIILRFVKYIGGEPTDVRKVRLGAVYEKLPVDGLVEVVIWIDPSEEIINL